MSSITPSIKTQIKRAELAECRLDDLHQAIVHTSDCRWSQFYPSLQKSSSKVNQLVQLQLESLQPIILRMQGKLEETQTILQKRSIDCLQKRIAHFSDELGAKETAEIMDSYETYRPRYEQFVKEVGSINHSTKDKNDSLVHLNQQLEGVWKKVDERFKFFNPTHSPKKVSVPVISTSSSVSSSHSSSSRSSSSSLSTSSLSSSFITLPPQEKNTAEALEDATKLRNILDDVTAGKAEQAVKLLSSLDTFYSWGKEFMTLSQRVYYYDGSLEIRSSEKLKHALYCVGQEFALNIFEQAVNEHGKESAEKMCIDLLKSLNVFSQYSREAFQLSVPSASTPESQKRTALAAISNARRNLKQYWSKTTGQSS